MQQHPEPKHDVISNHTPHPTPTPCRELVSHPAFNITNPNNCYSLFLAFARSPINFHAGGSCLV